MQTGRAHEGVGEDHKGRRGRGQGVVKFWMYYIHGVRCKSMHGSLHMCVCVCLFVSPTVTLKVDLVAAV